MGQRTSNSQPLALPARERVSSFRHKGLVSHRPLRNVSVQRRRWYRVAKALHVSNGVSESDILPDRSAENARILHHHAALCAYSLVVEVEQGDIVIENFAAAGNA